MGLWELTFPTKIVRRATHLVNDVSVHVGVVILHVLYASVHMAGVGGVGQLGMAHRSDGPASSLRMFGHVHWAMCGGGCQFEVLEEHACT